MADRHVERGLALLRIGLAATVVVAVALERPWRWAAVDDAFTRAPLLGLRVVARLPDGHGALLIGSVLLVAAALVLAAGRRWAAGPLAVLSWWVLGTTQLHGGGSHWHAVVWLALLLAVGREAPSTLAWARVLIASAYFFPGVWKLHAGTGWVFSDNLENHVLRLRFDKAWHAVPMPPSWVFPVLAAVTVVFELTFVFGVLSRRMRPWFGAYAIAFHLGLGLLSGLWFWPLMLLFPTLLVGDARPRVDRAALVAGPILLLSVLTGVDRNTGDWPVSAFPLFREVLDEPTATRVLIGDRLAGEVVIPWATESQQSGLERIVRRHRPAKVAIRAIAGADGARIVVFDVSEDEPVVIEESAL